MQCYSAARANIWSGVTACHPSGAASAGHSLAPPVSSLPLWCPNPRLTTTVSVRHRPNRLITLSASALLFYLIYCNSILFRRKDLFLFRNLIKAWRKYTLAAVSTPARMGWLPLKQVGVQVSWPSERGASGRREGHGKRRECQELSLRLRSATFRCRGSS